LIIVSAIHLKHFISIKLLLDKRGTSVNMAIGKCLIPSFAHYLQFYGTT